MINAEEHLPLVSKIAGQFYKRFSFKYGYDELFQAGCVGLMKAIKKFDRSKNFKFSTYAYTTIWGSIHNFARDDNWYIAKRNRDRIKKSYAPTSLDKLVGEEEKTPIIELISGDICEYSSDLKLAMDKLPQELKRLIIQKYFYGFELREISPTVKLSVTTLQRREKKALNLLREELMV